jgi:hypothetical protein
MKGGKYLVFLASSNRKVPLGPENSKIEVVPTYFRLTFA